MFRRILGIIILLVSIVFILVLLTGAYYTDQVVDSVGESVTDVLVLTIETLDTVSDTMDQTRATIIEANDSIQTASSLTMNLSQTVSDTRPVLDSMTTVVSQDIPDNIEAIQDALPNVAGVAGVVDTAMTTLSDFGINQTIPIPFNPITLDFDLGIEYEPEEPFDQTILSLGESLEGMPQELRSLQGDLQILSNDLELVSTDIQTTSEDLEAMNEQIAQFVPIVDQYIVLLDRITASLVRSQAQLLSQLGSIKTFLIVGMVLLSLTQLAPLYLGWELLSGGRGSSEQEAEPVIAAEPLPVVIQQKTPEQLDDPALEAPPPPPAPRPPSEQMFDPSGQTIIEGPYVDPADDSDQEPSPPQSEENKESG